MAAFNLGFGERLNLNACLSIKAGQGRVYETKVESCILCAWQDQSELSYRAQFII